MAKFESLSAPREYVSASKLFESYKGKEIMALEEGVFVKASPNHFNQDKNDWVFRAGDKEIVVNSSGSLDYQMKDVVPGTTVQIGYNGKTKIEKGVYKGKEAHQFDVKIDRSTIPAVTPSAPVDGDEDKLPY